MRVYGFETEDVDVAEAAGENESECEVDRAGVYWYTPDLVNSHKNNI